VPERRFLSAHGLGRRGSIQPMDLELKQGEVLGLGGLWAPDARNGAPAVRHR
jgi:ABC-type sugar transport system ATPase subunit